MNMRIHTPAVCAPVRVSATPTPQPSRLSTVTHLASPTPDLTHPPFASPGQPPAWHSRGLLSVCKTMAGVPEVQEASWDPVPPVPPPHSIQVYFYLQSLSPRSGAPEQELGGGDLTAPRPLRLLESQPPAHPSTEQNPAPATLPRCPSQPSVQPCIGKTRPSCFWPPESSLPPGSPPRLRCPGVLALALQGSQERPHEFLCSEYRICNLRSRKPTKPPWALGLSNPLPVGYTLEV